MNIISYRKGSNYDALFIHNEKNITMRHILAALVTEMGEIEGKDIFEWYCSTYNVDIADLAPAAIKREVLGL